MEVNGEEYNNFKKWIERSKDNFKNFKITVPAGTLANIPDVRQEEVLNSAKIDLIQIEIEKAKQLIAKINSPFKEKETAELKLNYRNFNRQLQYNRERLESMRQDPETPWMDGDRTVKRFEVEYLIDKFETEIRLLEREIEIYGLKKEELLR